MRPEIVVGCLIVNKNGMILICKSPKWKNLWVVPGGHIEYGETIEQSVKREVKEEVGLDVKFEKILFVQEIIEPKEYNRKTHFISLECVCSTINDKVKIDDREIKEYIWAKPIDALKMETDPYTHEFIKKYLEGVECPFTVKK
ncbi:MAG: NUDIX domain-containing protein [Candidatus Aenigmatarchaeota archaeon]